LADAITPKTILVSIMQANNEIGTVQPIKELAKIVKEKGAVFHTDAIASAGVIPLDVQELGVGALSFTCNQFYGPKGAGALYLKKGVRIIPFIEGGIQEEGKRAGTEAVPEIIGFGAAAELAKKEMPERIKKLTALRDKLMKGLQKKIENFYPTGHLEKRLPNHVSGCVEFIEGESMTMFLNMDGIAAATGSACVSRALKASHVLLGIGIDPALAHGSLVFTLGKDNIEEEVDYLLEKLPPIVQRLREMSPLYKKGG
jgi:cysteine desulfurase